MKRIMILPAVALTICLALPQFSQAAIRTNQVAQVQPKAVKYTETKAAQLPKAVSDALAKDYAGYKTNKAYKGDDGTFKVAVSKGTEKTVLFYSADGMMTKSKKPMDKAKTNKMKPADPMK